MNAQAQQQFAALQKATDVFKSDAARADALRRRETQEMAREQDAQRTLAVDVQAAHGAVGEEARRKTHLGDERKRVLAATEADRTAIQAITGQLKGVEADSKKQKEQFVDEIDALNEESDTLLALREKAKASRLLEAADVAWLVEGKVGALAGNAGGNNCGEDGELEKWSDVAAQVQQELAGIVDADEKGDAEAKACRELEAMLQGLRAKFLSVNGTLGQAEVADLEAKWEASVGYAANEEGENGMDVEGGKRMGEASGSTHMQIFYDDQEMAEEYEGPVHDPNAVDGIGHAC